MNRFNLTINTKPSKNGFSNITGVVSDNKYTTLITEASLDSTSIVTFDYDDIEDYNKFTIEFLDDSETESLFNQLNTLLKKKCKFDETMELEDVSNQVPSHIINELKGTIKY